MAVFPSLLPQFCPRLSGVWVGLWWSRDPQRLGSVGSLRVCPSFPSYLPLPPCQRQARLFPGAHKSARKAKAVPPASGAGALLWRAPLMEWVVGSIHGWAPGLQFRCLVPITSNLTPALQGLLLSVLDGQGNRCSERLRILPRSTQLVNGCSEFPALSV